MVTTGVILGIMGRKGQGAKDGSQDGLYMIFSGHGNGIAIGVGQVGSLRHVDAHSCLMRAKSEAVAHGAAPVYQIESCPDSKLHE
jgi:hypothetical protein